MLSLWDIVIIINVNNISVRTIQSKRGTPTPPVSFRLQQEIDQWKFPSMDSIKRFQHHRRSIWPPIFEWIIRTHIAYYNPNSAIIHHIKSSWPRVLVLQGTTLCHDDESSPWPTRTQTHHTI